MDRPRIYIDTNEQIDSGLYLFSKTDVKRDSSGREVQLRAGERVFVYMDETDSEGNVDNLIATGTVELNTNPRWPLVKWCFRIEDPGFMNESEVAMPNDR